MSDTLSISTTWLWELFPYNNTYPTPGEFGTTAPGAPNISKMTSSTANLLSDFSSSSAIDTISQAFNASQIAVSGPGELATLGLRNFSATRSKSSADGSASLTVVGKPPKNAYPGVWCCLTTVSPGTNQKRVRFIGQISSANYGYQVNPNGLVSQITTYTIREWSSILKVPVRVESLTISQSMNEPTPFNAASFISNKLGEKKWVDLISASYNPFQMATLVLQLIGALSTDNSKNQIKELANLNYSETAARMPIIPPALSKRLGIDSDDTNPFATGFVEIITGIRKTTDPKLYNESWDGIFNKNGTPSIEEYQDSHETENTGRPVGSNVGALMSINESAWNLLTQYCDPAHNEFFTDMLYELDEAGNEVTQPIFIFRDMPFLLNTIKDQIPNDLSRFSDFDTLPRVKLDSRAIMTFSFTNTILNSPNLIRVRWQDAFTNDSILKAQAISKGYSILVPEMLRFGGREYEAATNFVNLDPVNTDDPGYSSAEWFSQIRDVVTAWHSYNYRMGSGVLTLKDYNVAVSLGHNVEFEFGNFVLVGHVDSINFSVMVDEKGLVQNTMQLSLSRIVQKQTNGTLDFITPDQFGYLHDPEAVPNSPSSIQFPNFPSASDLLGGGVGDAINAIKGIFS